MLREMSFDWTRRETLSCRSHAQLFPSSWSLVLSVLFASRYNSPKGNCGTVKKKRQDNLNLISRPLLH